MTVSTTTNKVTYDGNGSTTAFAIPFYFLANDDIQVILRGTDATETTWTEGTQYSLTGAGMEAGGTLTVSTSPTDYRPATGEKLVITRTEQYTQPTDLPVAGPLPSQSVEQMVDRATFLAQQLKEIDDRTLRVPISDDVSGADLELPIDDVRASKLLGFDAQGKPTLFEASDAAPDSIVATGSTTAIATADRWARIYEPEDFGAVGDGVTDDSAAIQAMVDATPEGGVCRFRKTYAVHTFINISSKSITLTGPGRLHLAADTRILRIDADEETPISISSITYNDSYTFTGATVASDVASLTFASAPDIEVNDYLKIYSDDQITPGETGEKVGEFAKVGAVNGTTVYLYHRLRGTYTTTPKCAVFNDDVQVVLDGLTFTVDEAGDAAGWNSSLIYLVGLFNPIVKNCKFRVAYQPAVQLQSCFQGKVSNCWFEDLKNDNDTDSQNGYGVLDYSSEQTIVDRCSFVLGRHSYTSGASNTPTEPWQYGSVYGAIISNCVVFASSINAFDCHADARGCTFYNCHVYGSWAGQSGNSAGWQLRGNDNRIVNCFVENCFYAYRMYASESPGSEGNQIINSSSKNCARAYDLFDSGAGETQTRAIIQGGYHEMHESIGGNVINVDYPVDLLVENVRARRVAASGAGSGRFLEVDEISGSETHVRIKNCELDVRGDQVADMKVIVFDAGPTNVTIDGFYLQCGTTDWDSILNANNNTGTFYCRNFRCDKAPKESATLGVVNVGSLTDYAVEYLVADGRTANTNVFTQTVSATGQTVDPSNKIGANLVCVVTADNVASSITEIEDGVFDGQVLTIVSSASSTQDLDIVTGNQIALAASISLSPKQAQQFVWNLAAGKWLAAGGEGADLTEDPNTMKDDETSNLTVGFTTDIETIVFAASITPDITAEGLKELAVSGNWTLNCPAVSNGGSFAIRATNDASVRTLTLGSNVHNIGAGSYDSAANAVNVIAGVFYPGATPKLYIAIGQQ